jgi:hypothetical protein
VEPSFKVCTGCKQNKPFDQFNKAKLGKFGLRSICRVCQKNYSAARYKKKSEQICAYSKEYRKKEKDRISIQRSIHSAIHKERIALYGSEWRKNNPGKSNNRTAKRRARRNTATPGWLTKEQWKQIEKFYIESAQLTLKTGIPHEVDHIEPLCGKEICGLHVPWNLRIIPRSFNRRKGYNRL